MEEPVLLTGLAACGDAAPPMVCQRPAVSCSKRWRYTRGRLRDSETQSALSLCVGEL